MTFGLINLNKPKEWTSHDCVAKVRRLLGIKKVGHGGTLDPAATGVLPIAFGKATRLLQFMPDPKAYRALVRFGIQTSTDDLEGEIIQEQNAASLTLEQIKPYLKQFIGNIEQIPPAYSAIQQNGKRLYELARAGEKVDVPSRRVDVFAIDVLSWYSGQYPEVKLGISCGGGTYIRAIARDLGNCVGTGATLAALERTLSCGLSLETSLTLTELEKQLQQGTFTPISPDTALAHLNAIILPTETAQRWCQGQRLADWESHADLTQFVRVYNPQKQFLGIGEVREQDNALILAPKVVL
ncbi:MAG: tRNA pseudouridine(55) synthase TruB [Jaaginema sp. PMC 1079.18]|nr:tRNA pseudouridine(55) synthase TruB [Jaaginema sp. PMC 1080.18]MEC4852996.1 tRNA pseudouridine(55) synthase TruB [Jaaginema sp. PMC 1079.18]MEC4868041.1 tRNA pseudouridine(55) synthase TruB [Jaaginema sp. PMC 1078.18]